MKVFNQLFDSMVRFVIYAVISLITFFLLVYCILQDPINNIEFIWNTIRFIFYLSIFVWFFIMFFKLLDKIASKDRSK